jgi:hypothetical protein
MADMNLPFSETFRRRFSPREVEHIAILSVRGRPNAGDFEELRIGIEAAYRAGWRGVVCDVKEMAADADLEEQLECLVRCYTALSRAGTVCNFLHAKRLMKL